MRTQNLYKTEYINPAGVPPPRINFGIYAAAPENFRAHNQTQSSESALRFFSPRV